MHSLTQLRRAIPVFLVGLTLACFTLSPSVVAFRPEAHAKVSYKALTFAERVSYQRAIEEVYWRHRIWPKENPDPKPSLDAVMSQAELEKKVENYLRNSLVLEQYWQKPVTGEQLQAEMDRMARDTKQPEVLRELFDALGNDPAVIAECLARPILAERIIADLSGQSENLNERFVPAQGKASRQMSLIGRGSVDAVYTLPEISVPPRPTPGPSATPHATLPPRPTPRPTGCTDDSWTATSTTNAPEARYRHTAVWTGSEMIVWGGDSNTGGRYNPSTDSWTATSTINAPEARYRHTAVWIGSEMIVWGGYGGAGGENTGGRYNPSTDSWTATSTTNAPSGRGDHTAVWIGSEMIVWGGTPDAGCPAVNTGGRYNPSTDSWMATSTTQAPSARPLHTAVWTGSEMIVWGGSCGPGPVDTGGRYNPSTDTWTATSTINAPEARFYHTAIWTGSQMVVWGGATGNSGLNTGGRYNPSTNSWIATGTNNAPSSRAAHTAVWTGSEMIVWGGTTSTGGRYHPGTDTWRATSTTNAPTGNFFHTAVWTGSEMIVWGGGSGGTLTNTGGRYCARP
jgi:N-acetylneuraminic acid mutarotase